MTHETTTGYRPDDVVEWNPDEDRWLLATVVSVGDTTLTIKLDDNEQGLDVESRHVRLVTRRSVETDGLNLRDGGTPREDAIAGAVNHTSEVSARQTTAAAARIRALADRWPLDVYPEPPLETTVEGDAALIVVSAMRDAFEQAAQAVEGLLTTDEDIT